MHSCIILAELYDRYLYVAEKHTPSLIFNFNFTLHSNCLHTPKEGGGGNSMIIQFLIFYLLLREKVAGMGGGGQAPSGPPDATFLSQVFNMSIT